MSNALIRVADAGPVAAMPARTVADAAGNLSPGLDPTPRHAHGVLPSRAAFAVLLAWTLVHFTQFGFLDGTESWNIALVAMRYLLWPAIGAAFLLHLQTHGYTGLFAILRYLMPFLAIGVVSSMLGFSPPTSLRLVFFWTLGVSCAASIGLEVRDRVLWPTLFWSFFVFVAASIVFVIVDPKLGITRDTRVETGGAWRGLFPGKNLTGLICLYALLVAWFTPVPGRFLRIVCAAIAAVLMVFAASQGAIATGLLAAEYIVLVGMLRRSSLSPGVQAASLALATIATVAILLFGASSLLQLLGRDASFSGRTDIWAAFLTRASNFWLTGAGPGSFSLSYSPITADLAQAFIKYGTIHSPHNMFIAAFGELGIFGLLAYALPLLYFAFVLPCINRSSSALPAATAAFTMVTGGITETREVFGLGLNMFLLVVMIAAMERDRREKAPAPGVPAGQQARDLSVPADESNTPWVRLRALG